MEVKYKRADELDCGDVIVSDGIETVIEYLEVVSGYILINKNEVLTPPEAQLRLVCRAPSDLEIVQKALHQEYCNVELSANGSWQLFERISNSSIGIGGDETAALLTWAKQQIGVE